MSSATISPPPLAVPLLLIAATIWLVRRPGMNTYPSGSWDMAVGARVAVASRDGPAREVGEPALSGCAVAGWLKGSRS